MSLLKSPPEAPAIQIPFRVRMEPYLVESVCALARLVRDKGSQHKDIGGLLFGSMNAGERTIEALKTFVESGPHSDLARRQRMEGSYKSTLDEAKNDPELSDLEVVGWFSFRTGSGLLNSDVGFHNQHFRKQDDLALIVWSEGPSQITAEVYSKADGEALTAEDYRWGSVRLSADIRHMREPVELSMRVRLGDDSYLRTYDAGEPETQFSSLMRKAEAASDKMFSVFSRRKPEAASTRLSGAAVRVPSRLPDRSAWPPEAPESALSSGLDFNLDVQPPAPAAVANPPAAANLAPPADVAARPDFHLTEPRPTLPPSPALDIGKLGQAPRSRRAAPAEVSGVPMVLQPKQTTKSSSWPWAAGLFVACSAAVFAFLSLGGLDSDSGRLGQAFHAMFPGGALNMRVRTEDDRLRLTWNQRNHAVAAASEGTLQIFDGQQHREVHLEGRQVADGSVLYRPLTNDVTFRLEVRGEQGGASGSVRVLDGLPSQQPPLDVSAPRTAALAAPAPVSQETQGLNQLATSSAAVATLSPTLIRPNVAAPGSVGATAARSPLPRYETPQTVGTFPTAGEATINGWDTPATSRPKQRRATRAAYAGPGFVAPRPLMQVMPRTSSIPSGTVRSRTRVEVQVRVDPTGKVAAANVVSPGVNETIANAALSAARRWTFQPASISGRRVEGAHTIVFEFRP